MTPILRCLVIAGTLAVVLATGGAAEACTTPLDVGCSAGSTIGVAGEPVVDALGVLEGTFDDADDAVTDLVDGVGGTAAGAIDDVMGATPPVPGVEPPGILPPRSGGDPSGAPRGDDERDHRHRDRRTPMYGRASPPPAPVVRRSAAGVPVITTTTSAAAEAPLDGRGRVGDAIAAALPSFVALVALFGLALGFVAVQAWADRRDPRLAMAPSVDEVVRFR